MTSHYRVTGRCVFKPPTFLKWNSSSLHPRTFLCASVHDVNPPRCRESREASFTLASHSFLRFGHPPGAVIPPQWCSAPRLLPMPPVPRTNSGCLQVAFSRLPRAHSPGFSPILCPLLSLLSSCFFHALNVDFFFLDFCPILSCLSLYNLFLLATSNVIPGPKMPRQHPPCPTQA